MEKKKPNILLLFADQVRPDILGCCGGPARTPNLDWIASEGMRFTRCATPAPLCIPARVCLATGKYAHTTGAWNNLPYSISRQARTWMQQIRGAGYHTALLGKAHLHAGHDLFAAQPWMHDYGFDDVDEVDGPHANGESINQMTNGWKEKGLMDAYRADMLSRKGPATVKPSPLPLEDYYDVYVGQSGKHWLETYDDDKPWFCTVGFPGPHEPWDTPEPYASMYRPEDMPAPRPELKHPADDRPQGFFDKIRHNPNKQVSTETAARLRADYCGGVTLIDDQIGEILDVLRKRGELDNTIIVFTSDHGELNGDYGLINKRCYFYPVVDVPLILRVPGLTGGQVCNSLVEMSDLGPTLAELAGNPVDYEQFAISLLPLLEDPSRSLRSCVISECSGEIMYADDDWKIVVNENGKATLLIDLKNDPEESVNLAAVPEMKAEEDRLRLVLFEEVMKRNTRTPAVTQGENPPHSRGSGSGERTVY